MLPAPIVEDDEKDVRARGSFGRPGWRERENNGENNEERQDAGHGKAGNGDDEKAPDEANAMILQSRAGILQENAEGAEG
jgi:hypothetical protein